MPLPPSQALQAHCHPWGRGRHLSGLDIVGQPSAASICLSISPCLENSPAPAPLLRSPAATCRLGQGAAYPPARWVFLLGRLSAGHTACRSPAFCPTQREYSFIHHRFQLGAAGETSKLGVVNHQVRLQYGVGSVFQSSSNTWALPLGIALLLTGPAASNLHKGCTKLRHGMGSWPAL